MYNSQNLNTFWKLINEYQIIIPQLQRDYAQGRKNDSAIEQIRTSLVDELFVHLTNNTSLELNFIYGKTSEGIFTPIDGQQRLTTLFLLHWYIFSRSGYIDGRNQLKKFTYKTRDTSSRFCLNICDIEIDFAKSTVADQIRDCYWFTGNFSGDPTIRSMLVMIDALHTKFSGACDYENFSKLLTSDECPITFLWLQMEDFQKPDDLYIKMNARGKLLSDFEIFKAKLQNSAFLEDIIGQGCEEKDKITYISKYNNQYSEFFYKVFQEKFDGALMDFIKSVIREDYYCEIVKRGVHQRLYRDQYSKISNMNGNVFFSHLESNGINVLNGDEKQLFENGLIKAERLLNMFSQMQEPLQFEQALTKTYFNEKQLFINNHILKSSSDNVVRYALYEYLYKFNIPQTSEELIAYEMWKRFVYNIMYNTELGGHVEYVCQALAYFNCIVSDISESNADKILEAISKININNTYEFLKQATNEEKTKAKLMIPAREENVWYTSILDAENHFKDGQIGFLLGWSQNANDYEVDVFNKYFTLVKTIFDSDKRLVRNIDKIVFEQALLCMKDTTSNKTAHLLKQENSTTTWGFLGDNYVKFLSNYTSAKKLDILKQLLDILLKSSDIGETLKNIVTEFDVNKLEPKSFWKSYFITNNLFSCSMDVHKFKNCVHLSSENKEILLLTGTTVRAYSMEINTFLLYIALCKLLKNDISLNLDTTGILYDPQDFPKRYIRCRNSLIGYRADKGEFVIKTNESIEYISKEEILSRFSN